VILHLQASRCLQAYAVQCAQSKDGHFEYKLHDVDICKSAGTVSYFPYTYYCL